MRSMLIAVGAVALGISAAMPEVNARVLSPGVVAGGSVPTAAPGQLETVHYHRGWRGGHWRHGGWGHRRGGYRHGWDYRGWGYGPRWGHHRWSYHRGWRGGHHFGGHWGRRGWY